MVENILKSLLADPAIGEEQARKIINSQDHFEVARLLHLFTVEEKVNFFQYLTDEIKRQELLYETDVESRKEIVEALGYEYMAPLLEEMPKDEAADILKEHEPEIREKILGRMVPDDAKTLKELIRYEEETAGGMMAPNFNKVLGDELAGDILMRVIKETPGDNGTDFFVVDSANHLTGYFNLRDLLNVQPNAQASNIIHEETHKVLLDDTCEKIANLMDHEHLTTIPVVDENNTLHGIVTFDDVFRTLKKSASHEIYTMVGTDRLDPFAQKTMRKISARAPWLATTFVGGILSAFILRYYHLTLEEFTAVLLFIPFVLGLAGNVGIQGATVIVRGLATGDIQTDNLKAVIRSEIKVGIANGLIFGLACGLPLTLIANSLLETTPLLGLTVGLGIFLAVSMACIFGSLTPWLFMRMNIDPAISAGPVVTVVNDVLGLLIYLSTTAFLFSTFE